MTDRTVSTSSLMTTDCIAALILPCLLRKLRPIPTKLELPLVLASDGGSQGPRALMFRTEKMKRRRPNKRSKIPSVE